MDKKYLCQIMVVSFLVFAISIPVWAGGPAEKIKDTTDKIRSIVIDPALKDPGKSEEKKELIRRAVDERFDWEEMSRRSLARHWSKRTDEERREFVILFRQLLERTYLDKVGGFSVEKVHYSKEVLDGDYGTVETKIMPSEGVLIPVKYCLMKKENDWLVYDISIEGVSLVRNYRVQFNNMLNKSSYKKLIKRLKNKLTKK